MVTRQEKIRAGVFVAASVGLLVFFLTFLKYYSSLEESREYFFLFSGSVGGLDKGSKVAFNGVPIGKVKDIGFTPKDLSSIKVVLSINTPAEVLPILEDTRVSLKYVSLITGSLYVELKGGKGQNPHDPALPIPVEYSLLDDMEKKLDKLDNRFNEILAQIKDLLQEENRDKVKKFLADFQEASSHLKVVAANARDVMDNLDRTLTQIHDAIAENRGPVRRTLEDASAAVRSAKNLLAQLEEKKAVEVAVQAIEKAGQTAEAFTASSQKLTDSGQSLAKAGEHSLQEVNKLIDNLNRETTETLADARRTLRTAEDKLKEVSQVVSEVAQSAQSLSKKAEEAATSADKLLTTTNSLVSEASGEVRTTLEKIRLASENIDQLAKSLNSLVVTKTPALSKVLDNLKDASSELKEFAEQIRRQPSTLIGRPRKDERKIPE